MEKKKSYITEFCTHVIATCATAAVCINQYYDTPISDTAVTAFATAAGTLVVPLVLRTLHKKRELK